MILDSLRDRQPEMFAPRGHHALRMAKAQALAFKRRANLAKTTGTGKVRIAKERLSRYLKGILLLLLNPKIQRELAELRERQAQLAETGGYEDPARTA